MRPALLIVTLFVVGCGEPPAFDFSLNVGWKPLDCPQEDALVGQMQARAYIGGHEGGPCDLGVDTSLISSGDCPEIQTGLLRPLAIRYWILDSTERPRDLALILSWVDLRKQSVAANATVVEVDLAVNGSAQLDTNQELNDLPDNYDCSTEEADPLETCAKPWARLFISGEFRVDFESDDGALDLSNLEDICDDGLFE